LGIECSGMESATRQAVMRLAVDSPDWLPVLWAAMEAAKRAAPFGGVFAGRRALEELSSAVGRPAWAPGLHSLVAYGLLQKDGESSQGGRRAYYRMPDRAGVEEALSELRDRGVFPFPTS
jgi:hypothetical protein